MGYVMHDSLVRPPTKKECPNGLLIWCELRHLTPSWYKVHLTNNDTHYYGEVSIAVAVKTVRWWCELPPHPDEFKNGGG